MDDKQRLHEISQKRVVETRGNTIKAHDIAFMFRYIWQLERENERLKEKNGKK